MRIRIRDAPSNFFVAPLEPARSNFHFDYISASAFRRNRLRKKPAEPARFLASAVQSLGNLAGKIVIDCTNPLGMGLDGLGLVLGHRMSGGEFVAQWARQASVFKAFNTTGAANMAEASGYAVKPAMFVAGDDPNKKQQVMQLAADIGFDPVDAGTLRNARLLEPLAMLWIDQALSRGAGFAFAVVRK